MPTASLRHTLAVLMTVALVGTGASCARRKSAVSGPSPATGMDSVAGVILVTGGAGDDQVVLRSVDLNRRLLATSVADSAALRRLSGVEVMAWGRAEGRSFVVSRYRASRVDGRPVVDGILRQANGGLSIETPTGTRPLGNPPSALRALTGARVWLGGSLDTGPTTFGVIVPPR